jgi:hypothetical protein
MRAFGYMQDPNGDFADVSVTRDGRLVINNGRHRLACALLLGIDTIPVTICVRHTKWVEFVVEVQQYMGRHGNMLYSPVPHIDFLEYPIRQANRLPLVLDAMSTHDVCTVLDLGAQWGSMCVGLERVGKRCVAVEVNPEEFEFLNKIRTACDCDFEVVHADMCDYIASGRKFDCILALSVFHHLNKTEAGHAKLLKLLSQLDAKLMFFQMADRGELASMNPFVNYLDQQFIRLIIDNSCFNTCRRIGDFDKRAMYVFTR